MHKKREKERYLYFSIIFNLMLPKSLVIRSDVILGITNYYVLTSKNDYNALILFMLYCKILLGWDTVKDTGLVVWVGLRIDDV